MNTTHTFTHQPATLHTLVVPDLPQARRGGKNINRWLKPLTLTALLLLAAPVLADQTQTTAINFNTTNQSMWGPNFPGGISTSFLLKQGWNTGDKSTGGYKAGFGFKASGSSSGEAGIQFSAWANAGNVNVNYPVKVYLKYPDPRTIKPGQTFTISSSWAVDPSAQIQTQSPTAGAAVDAYLNGSVSANVKASAFSHEFLNENLINKNVNVTRRLFSTDQLTEGEFDVAERGILTGEYHLPSVATTGGLLAAISGVPGSNTWLSSTGSDTFVTVRGDISNLLAAIGDLPKLNDSKSKSYGVFKANYSYSVLDLYGELPLTLRQDFLFMPTPKITLALPNSQSVSFNAGDSVQVTFPVNAGSTMLIKPSVDLDNYLTNTTQLVISPSLKFQPLKVDVSGSFASLELQPIADMDLLSAIYYVPLKQNTFKLDGFQTATLNPITIVANPIPIVPL